MVQPKDIDAVIGKQGTFDRPESSFRRFVAPDSEFQPENDRYHLIISWACPWAHRCAMVRHMKGLTKAIGLSVVHPTWAKTKPDNPNDNHFGWPFCKPGEARPGNNGHGSYAFENVSLGPFDPEKVKFVRDLYEMSNDTLGRYSVPILWCKKTG